MSVGEKGVVGLQLGLRVRVVVVGFLLVLLRGLDMRGLRLELGD